LHWRSENYCAILVLFLRRLASFISFYEFIKTGMWNGPKILHRISRSRALRGFEPDDVSDEFFASMERARKKAFEEMDALEKRRDCKSMKTAWSGIIGCAIPRLRQRRNPR